MMGAAAVWSGEPLWVSGMGRPRVGVLVGGVEGQGVDVVVRSAGPGDGPGGDLEVGEAVVVDGGGSGVGSVVHVRAARKGVAGEGDPRLLFDGYVAALREADGSGARGVVMELIGTGAGWTARESVQQAFIALSRTGLDSVEEIVFVDPDGEVVRSAHEVLTAATEAGRSGPAVRGALPELGPSAARVVGPERWGQYMGRAGRVVAANGWLRGAGEPLGAVRAQVAVVGAVAGGDGSLASALTATAHRRHRRRWWWCGGAA